MDRPSVGWLAWVTGAIALAGCGSGGDAAPSAGVRAKASVEQRTVEAPATDAYAFFVATRIAGGYQVAAVNGAAFSCGFDRAATACDVSNVDLSPLDLAPSTAAILLAQIGRDPAAPALLFVGAVSGGALEVEEVWRAPSAVPFVGTALLVANQPSQALVVNRWSAATVGAIDFSTAAEAVACVLTDDAGPLCAPSYGPATTDVISPTGVVLTGETGSDGTLHVRQYFLKVSTGFDDDGDGYSYCTEGQQLCPDNACYVPEAGGCTGVHWGGRGEKPEVTIYDRSTNPSVDAWLVATGQLAPADVP